MKKLKLNKEVISRLDNPQRIYGGGDAGGPDTNPTCNQGTCQNTCNQATCATCDQFSCVAAYSCVPNDPMLACIMPTYDTKCIGAIDD